MAPDVMTGWEVFFEVSMILGGVSLLCGYIAWPIYWTFSLDTYLSNSKRSRKEKLRFLWLTPIYFIPFLYIALVEFGGKMGKAFREAWIDDERAANRAKLKKAKADLLAAKVALAAASAKLDETKFKRSDETNFKGM